jgi:hypothetical protein
MTCFTSGKEVVKMYVHEYHRHGCIGVDYFRRRRGSTQTEVAILRVPHQIRESNPHIPEVVVLQKDSTSRGQGIDMGSLDSYLRKSLRKMPDHVRNVLQQGVRGTYHLEVAQSLI